MATRILTLARERALANLRPAGVNVPGYNISSERNLYLGLLKVIISMKSAILFSVISLVCLSVEAASPVKLSDDELHAKISGVWFGEQLLPGMRHIGQRSQYYP